MTTMDSAGNIRHVKGDTFYVKFINVKNDGITIDWTGYTAKFVVKTAIGGKTILTLTQTTGIDLTTNGIIIIQKSATDMSAIAARSYVYDLQLTKSGVVDTWFNNKILEIVDEVAS